MCELSKEQFVKDFYLAVEEFLSDHIDMTDIRETGVAEKLVEFVSQKKDKSFYEFVKKNAEYVRKR